MSETLQHTIHDIRFPNETAEYRAARDRLLEAEMALRRQAEAVAAQRRALPPGGRVPQDYLFEEGDDARQVWLSELFGDKPVLLLYSFMYRTGDGAALSGLHLNPRRPRRRGAAYRAAGQHRRGGALADRAFPRLRPRARLVAAAAAVLGQ